MKTKVKKFKRAGRLMNDDFVDFIYRHDLDILGGDILKFLVKASVFFWVLSAFLGSSVFVDTLRYQGVVVLGFTMFVVFVLCFLVMFLPAMIYKVVKDNYFELYEEEQVKYYG